MELKDESSRGAKAAESSGGPSVFSDCELSWKPVDNISKIGEIHENAANGKCGYEACWKGLESECPTVNDFIDEFSDWMKRAIEKYEKDGEPFFLNRQRRRGESSRWLMIRLLRTCEDFWSIKKAQRSKRKLGSALRSVVF